MVAALGCFTRNFCDFISILPKDALIVTFSEIAQNVYNLEDL
jgi:hypothetical protein